MEIEFEATFLDIEKEDIIKRLKNAGAELAKPEFLQRRYTFNLPKGFDDYEHCWARVRDEGDKITMTYKEIKGDNIEDQKEITLEINDFEVGKEFLEKIGCKFKSYQETKRELWKIDDVEVCIDEWPFLEPYVEVEAKSEEKVKQISERIGLDYSKALFCSATKIYFMKYGVPIKEINNHVPRITFNMENPFLKYKDIIKNNE